jgi:L-fuconolactonase
MPAMIIDTHIHLYDPSRPQGVPWPDPNEEVLYRTVLPEDFKAVASPHGVTAAVVVEASVWLEDNQWVLDLAESEPVIVGFVGRIDPSDEDFPRHIERFAANPIYRGIRARPTDFETLTAGSPLRHMRLLAEKDLCLDVMAYQENLDSVIRLAEEIVDLRIVINHLGQVTVDGAEPPQPWQDKMRRAAEHPLVCCKVSRLPESAVAQPAPSDPEYYRPVLDFLFDAFGEDRLIYGSNWPVSDRASTYAAGLDALRAFLASKGQEIREKILWQNAKAVYRWPER